MADRAGLAHRFFGAPFETLSHIEQRVIHDIIERRRTAVNVNKVVDKDLTYGQRIADRVAEFGGSWTFIIIFLVALVSWVVLNSFILARMGDQFDPYPYILLNLFLSMLAAFQAPVIMMSQNRQAAKDRADMAHDYEVNLKSEMELMQLHDKMDLLVQKKWQALIDAQQEQIAMLNRILQHTEQQAVPPTNLSQS
jgi:Predicted membrane protein